MEAEEEEEEEEEGEGEGEGEEEKMTYLDSPLTNRYSFCALNFELATRARYYRL